MARTIDWRCRCGYEVLDCLAADNEQRACPQCSAPMEQVWWNRRSANAQWDDSTSILLHVHPGTGDIRYPGQHTAKLKDGYERVYLRSLSEVNRFERTHGVANEAMHFDRNGRGLDDYVNGEKVTH